MDLTSVVGLIAAAGATAANVPQALKVWRTSETGDLSLKMLGLLTASLLLWTLYGVLRSDFIIVASNAISAGLAGYLTFAKVRYG